jgi:hypothetical protein
MSLFGDFAFWATRIASLIGLLLLAAVPLAHATNYVGWVLADQTNATANYTANPKYSFNSAGKPNYISPQGNGLYYVYLEQINIDAANDNVPTNVQVSAYDAGGWCVVVGWAGAPGARATVQVRVQCFDANGKGANTEFTVLFQSRSAPFGSAHVGIAYVEGDQPTTTGSYTATKYESFNSTGGTNAITNGGSKTPGQGYSKYSLTIPGLNRIGGNVQVTPLLYRERCKPVSWGVTSGGATIDVECYNYLGIPEGSQFTAAYSVGEPLG